MNKPLRLALLTLLAANVLSILPVQAGEPGNNLALPYLAVGGAPNGWHFTTRLFLSNPSDSSNTGTIEFFDNRGESLSVALNGGTDLIGQMPWSIPPHETAQLVFTHPGDFFQAGWLGLKPSQKPAPLVSVVVQFYNGPSLIVETGIRASPRETMLLPYYMAAWLERPPEPSARWQEVTQKEQLTRLIRLANMASPSFKLSEQPWTKFGEIGLDSSPVRRGRKSKYSGGFAEVGYASWYGDPYHGRRTANGETYDQCSLTAAHPTLPFGAKVRVLNLRNGHSIIVHVNDRGPFVKHRVIDLSRAGAGELGMINSGIALVRLEVLPGN